MDLKPETLVVRIGTCEVELVRVRLLRKGANREAMKIFGRKQV
jgi:hypothetical protein